MPMKFVCEIVCKIRIKCVCMDGANVFTYNSSRPRLFSSVLLRWCQRAINECLMIICGRLIGERIFDGGGKPLPGRHHTLQLGGLHCRHPSKSIKKSKCATKIIKKCIWCKSIEISMQIYFANHIKIVWKIWSQNHWNAIKTKKLLINCYEILVKMLKNLWKIIVKNAIIIIKIVCNSK